MTLSARTKAAAQLGKPLPLILVKRLTIFLWAICLLALLFWYTGSFQSFLDSTQAMLMALLRFSSLGLVAAATLGLALSAAYALLRRFPVRIAGLVTYVLLLVFAGICIALSDGLLLLHAGLRH